ncbi:MAG TPA: hypothetical protein VMS31_23150 [Pyrinomonadaceae bacterium]|nr:hypothetical protein [Pyrinomonadaceae bacterium]
MRHEPFTVFYIRNLLQPSFYRELAETFPALSDFRYRENLGNKFLLTEAEGKAYYDFVSANATWQKFHAEIKSLSFREQLLTFLRSHLSEPIQDGESAGRFTSRFEFSALPTNGGSQRPHTDSPRKIVTLVLSLMKEGEWSTDWGGGTSICTPKDSKLHSNYSNQYLDFEDVKVIDTFPFVANACVMFVKTAVSWHCVTPITLPDNSPIRKTVAISLYHPEGTEGETSRVEGRVDFPGRAVRARDS